MIEVKAADLFCGAGGASNGLVRACRELGLKLDLLAINHWPTAVATHSKNHPTVRHLCESIDRVDPLKEVPGGRLHLLLAGPECTHFSAARGGRPVNPQSRASAWQILKWAQELYIDTILIENVPEFRTWGPIGANGKPLKSKAGETYQAFLSALRSLGYKVDDKILNSADYGDPTTRRRNFILARRGRHAVQWPGATHSRAGGKTLFGRTQRWKPAREVIDWTQQGKSIFNRKTPLAPATMARIIAGLEKFGGPELKPFLVVLRRHMAGQSLDGPLPTVAAQGTHVGLAQPFIIPVNHGAGDVRTNSVDEPLPTLTARANQYLVQPYVLSQASGGAPRKTEEPLPTMTTDGAIALVQPFMVPLYMERQGQTPRTHSVDEPVPTIPATGGGKFGVVEPFILSAGSRVVDARAVDDPMPTVTCSDRLAIAEPYIVQTAERRRMEVDSVDNPLRTVTAMAGRCFGLAEPFVTKYNGTSKSAQSVDEPLETVTSKDRFGLVQPVVDGYMLDINFRMLQPHELAGAMSFPKDYVFTGKREDVIKQIGNAWAGETSTALCKAILSDMVVSKGGKTTKEVA